MKKSAPLLVFFTLAAALASGQTIKVSGQVVGKDGAGKSGCKVSLLNSGVQVDVGADGKFSIDETMSVSKLADGRTFSYMEGGRLHFTAVPGQDVSINILNSQGRVLRNISNGPMSAGSHSLQPMAYIGSQGVSGVYYVEIAMGQHRNRYMVTYMGAGAYGRGIRSEKTPSKSQQVLRKMSADKEVLSVYCDGIFQRSVDVSATDTDIGTIKALGKPNIVLFYTDDQSYWETGHYGNPVVTMPYMDSLSKHGVTFKYGFPNSNICKPARASIMMSQFAGTHKAGFDRPTDSTVSKAEFAYSYPVLMRKAGYKTFFAGKWGFPVTTNKIANVKYRKDGSRDQSSQIWKHDSTMPSGDFDVWHGVNGQGSYWQYCDGKGTCPNEKWPNGTSKHLSSTLGNQAIDFIKKFKDSPMLVNVFYKAPHGAYSVDPQFNDIYKGVGKMPRHKNQGAEFKSLLPVQAAKYARCASIPDDGQLQTRGKLVYGADVSMGRVVETIKAEGLLENTVIVYHSDNGHADGAHGCQGKDLNYDHMARVPFVVIDPRVAPSLRKNRWLEDPAMTIDIGPTFMTYAGVDVPKIVQGINLVPVLNGEKAMERESIFQEMFFSGYKFPSLDQATSDKMRADINKRSPRNKAVRTKDLHYIKYYEANPPLEELFDITKDSLEIKNVAKDPAYSAQLEKMRKLYDEWEKMTVEGRKMNEEIIQAAKEK